jgi:hypothetical protein
VTHTTAATFEQSLDAVDTGRCSMLDKCRIAYMSSMAGARLGTKTIHL